MELCHSQKLIPPRVRTLGRKGSALLGESRDKKWWSSGRVRDFTRGRSPRSRSRSRSRRRSRSPSLRRRSRRDRSRERRSRSPRRGSRSRSPSRGRRARDKRSPRRPRSRDSDCQAPEAPCKSRSRSRSCSRRSHRSRSSRRSQSKCSEVSAGSRGHPRSPERGRRAAPEATTTASESSSSRSQSPHDSDAESGARLGDASDGVRTPRASAAEVVAAQRSREADDKARGRRLATLRKATPASPGGAGTPAPPESASSATRPLASTSTPLSDIAESYGSDTEGVVPSADSLATDSTLPSSSPPGGGVDTAVRELFPATAAAQPVAASRTSALLSFLEADLEPHALTGVSSEGRRLVAALGRYVDHGMDSRLEAFARTQERQVDDWLRRSAELHQTLARDAARENQAAMSQLSALVTSQMQLFTSVTQQPPMLPPWAMAPPGWGFGPPPTGPASTLLPASGMPPPLPQGQAPRLPPPEASPRSRPLGRGVTPAGSLGSGILPSAGGPPGTLGGAPAEPSPSLGTLAPAAASIPAAVPPLAPPASPPPVGLGAGTGGHPTSVSPGLLSKTGQLSLISPLSGRGQTHLAYLPSSSGEASRAAAQAMPPSPHVSSPLCVQAGDQAPLAGSSLPPLAPGSEALPEGSPGISGPATGPGGSRSQSTPSAGKDAGADDAQGAGSPTPLEAGLLVDLSTGTPKRPASEGQAVDAEPSPAKRTARGLPLRAAAVAAREAMFREASHQPHPGRRSERLHLPAADGDTPSAAVEAATADSH